MKPMPTTAPDPLRPLNPILLEVPWRSRCRPVPILLVALALWIGGVATSPATPQFARAYQAKCTACHTVVPMLNARGMSFEARGYRGSEAFEDQREGTFPMAVWITGRHEEQFSRDFGQTFLPKVELISGGPISEELSYFAEWRLVSLESRSDGTLRDRSGRFEDAFLSWDASDRLSLILGQYRSLRQVDVSRRLSVSEPAIFSASLPGDAADDPRVQSLRSFSPSGRSPGLTLGWQSIEKASPADGLFHFVTLPFPGEFSLPLSREARREASFEIEGTPKGVFLESFYRAGFHSIGAHAFLDDDRWLLTGVGTTQFAGLHLLGGLGVDAHDGASPRLRTTLQAEYLLPQAILPRDIGRRIRPGLGLRFEHLTHTGRDPAWIPYLAVSGPAGPAAFLVQLEYRSQPGNNALILDFSWLF